MEGLHLFPPSCFLESLSRLKGIAIEGATQNLVKFEKTMDTWAVIKTGGKQYKVHEGQTIAIEKLALSTNSTVSFDHVLVVGGEHLTLGTPFVGKATVLGKILETKKGKKIRVVKFRPKSRYLRTTGHRQAETRVLIEKIQLQ